MYLSHIDEGLPHPSTVLLQYPLLQALAPHQVKHTVLKPQETKGYHGQIHGATYLVSTPEVERALRNVDGNSVSVTMGEATSFWRSSISSG